jgi:hypothetical protein
MSFAPKATAAVQPPAKPSELPANCADAGVGTLPSAVVAGKGNSSSNTERRLAGTYSNLNSSKCHVAWLQNDDSVVISSGICEWVLKQAAALDTDATFTR